MTDTSRPYVILDVFTTRAFKGNPLAVVLEAEGLSDAEMQEIAREFNLSETVFVFPPENPQNDVSLRIFTPAAELPFAGHPTVGAAVLLAKRLKGEVDTPTDVALAMEEKAGLVRAGVVNKPGRSGHATFTTPQIPREIAPAVSRVLLAEAIGLEADDIGFDRHRPGVFSAGTPFTLIPVKNMAAIKAVKPNPMVWERAFSTADRDNAFIYTRGGIADEASFHARMFWPLSGISEDAATGSAIAGLAAAITAFEKLANGSHSFLIEQGYEMGRDSDITLEIDVEDGEIFSVRIGGEAVIVAEGRLFA